MKTTIKISLLFFLSLFIFSCSTDDDGVDVIPEDKNLNAERFINFEIGNSNFIVPQSAADIHLNFDYDYKGQSKISKITLHAIAINVNPAQEGEKAYELKDYVVDDKYYIGKLNPNIHLNLFVDPEGKESPKFKAATGSYQFRIVVEHEDGSKAIIVKEFSIVQKFRNLKTEIEEEGLEKELRIEFQYLTGSNTLEEVQYTLYHEDLEAEQRYTEILSETNVDFQGEKDPNVHFHVEWENDYPKGVYYILLKVKETGEDEYVKLVRKFEAVETNETIPDKNPERFIDLEVGNSNSTIARLDPDLHIEFDYEGKSKVKEMFFDISPVNVVEPGVGEEKWELPDFLVQGTHPGQINPHIHYHLVFKEEIKFPNPRPRPATGVYNLKITVFEEDGSESHITKQFEIVAKLSTIEIGNNSIEIGNLEIDNNFIEVETGKKIDIKFEYDAGENALVKLSYQLLWQEDNKWHRNTTKVPEEQLKKGVSIIDHAMEKEDGSDFSPGQYWLTIIPTESVEYEATLTLPLPLIINVVE